MTQSDDECGKDREESGRIDAGSDRQEASSSDAFWRFSCAFYAVDGVSERLLSLQDTHGCDVNLLLFALWRQASGRDLEPSDLTRATTTARDWRAAAVEPLRALRRSLKPRAATDPDAEALRARVKSLELEAERLQQAKLAAIGRRANAAPRADLDAEAMLSALKRVAAADEIDVEAALPTLVSLAHAAAAWIAAGKPVSPD